MTINSPISLMSTMSKSSGLADPLPIETTDLSRLAQSDDWWPYRVSSSSPALQDIFLDNEPKQWIYDEFCRHTSTSLFDWLGLDPTRTRCFSLNNPDHMFVVSDGDMTWCDHHGIVTAIPPDDSELDTRRSIRPQCKSLDLEHSWSPSRLFKAFDNRTLSHQYTTQERGRKRHTRHSGLDLENLVIYLQDIRNEVKWNNERDDEDARFAGEHKLPPEKDDYENRDGDADDDYMFIGYSPVRRHTIGPETETSIEDLRIADFENRLPEDTTKKSLTRSLHKVSQESLLIFESLRKLCTGAYRLIATCEEEQLRIEAEKQQEDERVKKELKSIQWLYSNLEIPDGFCPVA